MRLRQKSSPSSYPAHQQKPRFPSDENERMMNNRQTWESSGCGGGNICSMVNATFTLPLPLGLKQNFSWKFRNLNFRISRLHEIFMRRNEKSSMFAIEFESEWNWYEVEIAKWSITYRVTCSEESSKRRFCQFEPRNSCCDEEIISFYDKTSSETIFSKFLLIFSLEIFGNISLSEAFHEILSLGSAKHETLTFWSWCAWSLKTGFEKQISSEQFCARFTKNHLIFLCPT